ncbi:hypothetical protein GI584_16290 [Gracilibacillus salitolerans]|uniref:Uncharacterized protein n=1 Tax=Gracilibacillus salitolerans TaxID=2663022 RepID=A0A5Q2TND0_9BACI|nr:hypothetical protein [Gracilibacillus salitolerans]QGH35513.1 hypothetical protein GI584_16290 [Gracilibacillus salitolerans]
MLKLNYKDIELTGSLVQQHKGCEMMTKFLTAALSVIIFATIFSWISYVPSSQREPNVYYFGFLETFAFVIIYAGPVYFLIGLPLSIFIDKLIKNSTGKTKWQKYFVGLGLYSLVGTLVGVIFLIIFSQNIYQLEVISFSIYGIVASNIYFHVSLLISKINKK